MKVIEVLQPFAWSHNGWDVTRYAVGDIVQVSDDCADTEEAAGAAKVLTEADLVRAQEAYARLVRAAIKAWAASDKAKSVFEALLKKAQEAQERADNTGIGRLAEQYADELGEDEPEAATPEAAAPAPAPVDPEAPAPAEPEAATPAPAPAEPAPPAPTPAPADDSQASLLPAAE